MKPNLQRFFPTTKPISASQLNRALDAIENAHERIDRIENAPQFKQMRSGFAITLRCANTTGATVYPLTVLAMDDITFPSASNPENEGDIPAVSWFADTKDIESTVVAMHEIQANEIGEFAIGGIMMMLVNVIAEADKGLYLGTGTGTSAIPQSQAWGGWGKILWKQSGTGVKYALVQWPVLGQMSLWVATEDYDAGTTIKAKKASSTGAGVGTEYEIPVNNSLGS